MVHSGSIQRVGTVGITCVLLLLASNARPAAAQTLQSITVTPADLRMAAGFSQVYVATGHYSDGSTRNLTQQVTWRSSNTGVATITNINGLRGLATTIAPGTTRITAEMANGLNPIRGTTGLTVTNGELVSITTKPTTKNLEVGQPSQFKATALYRDESTEDVTKTVVWSSSDPSIASVSNVAPTQGLVTPHKPGQVTITAFHQATGVSNTDGATNVRAQVSHISFDPPTILIGKGIDFPLRVYANRVDGTRSQITDDVEFSVVPGNIISIGTGDNAGVVKTLKNGVATVSAYDPKRNLTTLTPAKVKVRGKLVSLHVRSNPMRIAVGEEKNARAVGLLKSGKETTDLRRIVQWSVADPTIATVGNTPNDVGQVVGKKSGVTTLRATYKGKVSVETDNLQVLGQLQSIALEIGDGLIPIDEEVELKARATYEGNVKLNVSDRCSWSVVNPNIAEIDNADSDVDGDGKGWIRGKALGQTTVNVTCEGKKASAQIRVIGKLEGIRIEPAGTFNAEALDAKQYRAYGQYQNSAEEKELTKLVTWTSSNPTVANVDTREDPGTVVALGTGTATITAQYGPFSASGTFKVGAGIVEMFILPPSLTIRGSDYSKLKARARTADGDVIDVSKRAVWTSNNVNVARVSNRPNEQGLAFGGKQEGTTTIVASLPNTPFSAETTVTTKCLLQSFVLVRPSGAVPVGEAKRVKARGTFCDGSTRVITQSMELVSSNPNVLLVTNEPKAYGVLTGVSPGTATITAVDVATGMPASNSLLVTVK